MNATAFRSRFVTDGLATSSPQVLLVRLYDRLVRDLTAAEAAQRAGDRGAASTQLLHAQSIVEALAAGLDADAWEGAAPLQALYTFVTSELVSANVTMDADKTASCLALVEPLRQAWHGAATGGEAGAGSAMTTVQTSA